MMPAAHRRWSASALAAGAAHAQAGNDARWPERPIRFIVPFSAGSSSDTVARLVGQKLAERLGQQLRGREPRGRRRRPRHRASRARRARRLHGWARQHQHPCCGREPHQSLLRSGQGLRAGIDARELTVPARALSRCGRQNRAGADRARQGQAADDELCLRGAGDLGAPVGRAVREDGEDRAHPRALSRHRAIHARPARGPGRDAVRHHSAHTRPYPRRQDCARSQ